MLVGAICKPIFIVSIFSLLYFYCFYSHLGMFGNVTYGLIGDHSVNFNVDSISGSITVQNSSFLDRERMPEASFSAVAVDKAPVTTRHSVIVPVNSNSSTRSTFSQSKKKMKKKSENIKNNEMNTLILMWCMFAHRSRPALNVINPCFSFSPTFLCCFSHFRIRSMLPYKMSTTIIPYSRKKAIMLRLLKMHKSIRPQLCYK